jgi:hypothetical protein
MHKNTIYILGNPSQTREKNLAKFFAIIFKRNTFTTKNILAHKRVHKTLENLAPKRGGQLLPRSVLA